MNPHLCRIVLRPRDPLEVFDLSVRFVRERWRPILRLTAVTVGPIWLLCAIASWWFEGHWGLLAVPFVLAAPLQAPFTVLSGRLLFADQVRVRSVLWEVLTRLPALIAAWIAGAVGWLFAAGVSCGILLPVTQAGLLYLTEAALLERVGPQRGLSRSMRLAAGHSGISFLGAMSWWFLVAWMGFVGELTGQFVVGSVLQMGQPFGAMLEGWVTPWLLGGLLLAQPAHAIYRLLLYVDVRTRVEGWDLQVALRAAGLAR